MLSAMPAPAWFLQHADYMDALQGRSLHEQGRKLHEQLAARWSASDATAEAGVPPTAQPLPIAPLVAASAGHGDDDAAADRQAAEPPAQAFWAPQPGQQAPSGNPHPAAAEQSGVVLQPEDTAAAELQPAAGVSEPAATPAQPAAGAAAAAAPGEPAAPAAAVQSSSAGSAETDGASGTDQLPDPIVKTTAATDYAIANGDEKAVLDWLKPPATS